MPAVTSLHAWAAAAPHAIDWRLSATTRIGSRATSASCIPHCSGGVQVGQRSPQTCTVVSCCMHTNLLQATCPCTHHSPPTPPPCACYTAAYPWQPVVPYSSGQHCSTGLHPAFSSRAALQDLISRLPKAELHIHVEGTLEPELMFELAARNKVKLPYPNVEAARKARCGLCPACTHSSCMCPWQPCHMTMVQALPRRPPQTCCHAYALLLQTSTQLPNSRQRSVIIDAVLLPRTVLTSTSPPPSPQPLPPGDPGPPARSNFTCLQDFLDAYNAAQAALVTRQDFHDLAAAYLAQARANNITHLELFFDAQSHADRWVEHLAGYHTRPHPPTHATLKQHGGILGNKYTT